MLSYVGLPSLILSYGACKLCLVKHNEIKSRRAPFVGTTWYIVRRLDDASGVLISD